MNIKYILLFVLNYAIFNSYAYSLTGLTKNVISQNSVMKQSEPGCIDPTACNYDKTATEDNGNCTYDCISPEVVCPDDTEIYLCVPNTTPPAKELIDFIPSENTTLLETLLFNPETSEGVNPNFTLTIYSYVIEDSRGNQRTCIQRYYNTNKPIDPPELSVNIDLCQGEFWSFIRKPLLDNYRFYADDRGSPGELLRVCQFPYSVCSTANFNLDTSKPGISEFWVTSFIRFTSDEICESEPVLITINVRPNPEATLVEKTKILQVGEYVNLREMVNGDQSGVWKGDEIISFSIPNNDTWHFFGSGIEGTRKLYYTIGNEFCTKTLILVVRVVSSGSGRTSFATDSNLKLYPNPSNGSVFVNTASYQQKNLTITVTDLQGKVNFKYETSEVHQGLIHLDLSHLSKGLYLVEIRNQSIYSAEKLMLK